MMWSFRLTLIALLIAAPSGAQSVDLIEERLTDVRSGFFELGPFYATPVVRFTGGYDSNALSTPEAQSDIAALLGPGIRLALPMGSNAFFDMFQEVDFVYYKDNVDLRRIFDITRLGGGWGGRRFLLQINNEFRDETRRPTTEFDSPVEMRTNEFDASMTIALGWRHQLSARYDQTRSKIEKTLIDDGAILDRLNYVRDSVSMDFSRRVSAKTNAVTQVFYEKLSIDDPTRDSDSYGMRAGFDFSPTLSSGSIVPSSPSAGLSGQLLVGFRRLIPVDVNRVEYAGLIGSVDAMYVSSDGHRLAGIFSRDAVTSILGENSYFIEQRFGGSFSWQLHRRFSIEPGIMRGKNDYPLPRLLTVDGDVIEQEIVDEHISYRLSFTYGIRPGLDVGVTTEYLDRRSNVLLFEKNRLMVNFFMTLAP
ncbi:MAG: hypothetical protein E2P02_08205 [Acidobacteria bacterium]|nr:MAG: hypothetical protein E2P02_08205 [Acidobacteriota bacterium]